MEDHWIDFYELTKNSSPSPLLMKAVSFIRSREFALDLGAGGLKDSKYLLALGFKNVWALDRNLVSRTLGSERFKFIQTDFERFVFPQSQFDLVNAQFSLPFIATSEEFSRVWVNIVNSLKADGVFTGQFFGPRDGWNVLYSKKTFHTKNQIEKLLNNMEVIELAEIEREGALVNGKPKYWHYFNVIARK